MRRQFRATHTAVRFHSELRGSPQRAHASRATRDQGLESRRFDNQDIAAQFVDDPLRGVTDEKPLQAAARYRAHHDESGAQLADHAGQLKDWIARGHDGVAGRYAMLQPQSLDLLLERGLVGLPFMRRHGDPVRLDGAIDAGRLARIVSVDDEDPFALTVGRLYGVLHDDVVKHRRLRMGMQRIDRRNDVGRAAEPIRLAQP